MVTTLLYHPTPPGHGYATGANITSPATRCGKSSAISAPSAPLQECTTNLLADTQLFERLIDHSALDRRRRILRTRARAPAMPGTVDQDHPMIFGEHVAKRPPHLLQI